jgi:two-component system, NtrC family, response regulator HydG
VAETFLLVVRVSDSFSEFWPLLAREHGMALIEWSPESDDPVPSGAAILIVAAGGREEELVPALARLGTPGDGPVIAVGAIPSHRLAARAVASGAADYFALPEDRDALRETLAAALQRRRAKVQRASLAQVEAQSHAFREIIGDSAPIRAVLERAARILPHADATVLITGETGTGKELLARALHYGGPRAAAPFVELNCAALPPQLLESELFGHERGAFTDARTAKPGLFEVADGGTLFLDEVHQLAPELQAKLLRALEQKTVRRVGGTATRQVNVRIVAATNAELGGEVRAGRLREDLYFRLNVITLTLPPLRERGDDVITLAEFFLTRLCAQYGLPEPPISPDVRRRLRTWAWPGNVRELRNAIERSVLLSAPGELSLAEIASGETALPGALGPVPFPATLDEILHGAAQAMLDLTGGNRSEAARRLGISRARLHRLLADGSAGEAAQAD